MELQGEPHGRRLQSVVHEAFRTRRPIDLDTDFFEVGFTSVLLAEVASLLTERGLETTIVDVYAHPTVRQLASALRRRYRQGDHAAPPWLADGTGR